MASRFVKLANNATVYEKKGNGILDPVMNPEDFYKRSGSNDIAGNTQIIDDLNNAYQDEINAQANAQYDPQVALAEQQANEQRGQATTGTDRLKQTIAKLFQQKRENDPLARQGIYSGAADIFTTNQNVEQVTNAETDLQSTLKEIAGRLGAVKQGATTGKAGLAAQIRQQYAAANQDYMDRQAAAKRQAEMDAADANKVSAVDMGDRIAFTRADGTIVKEVRKGQNPGTRGGSGESKAKDPGYKFNVINKIDDNTGQMKGIEITDKTGKPITLNKYISGYATEAYSPADFIGYLERSSDPGDQQIVQDIRSGMSTAELIKKYPWVFGD
jgi:hypothetical protein